MTITIITTTITTINQEICFKIGFIRSFITGITKIINTIVVSKGFINLNEIMKMMIISNYVEFLLLDAAAGDYFIITSVAAVAIILQNQT